MHNSKYKSKVDKIKTIGLKTTDDNLSEEEAKEALTNILNKTILKKKQIDCEDLNTDIVESVLKAIDKKHDMYIGYIMPTRTKQKNMHYSFSLRLRSDHLDTVFARTMLEGMCKSLLVIYYYIKLKEDNNG